MVESPHPTGIRIRDMYETVVDKETVDYKWFNITTRCSVEGVSFVHVPEF